ncbi:type II toxin-antitoxin system RelE/ParE family toxin [Chlorobium sp. N1]|uniref:type II toxin-antitoxin system RelE/ParE family toxin n=1 Tax=Chlorobium sp. N1 TaxID=2491138 RepID=UPI001A93C1AE|nr:type II toxin-antitoxin system RelE/ParE family toxin [Chlorobium sp. N1]
MVRWTEEARIRLTEIEHYIARDSKKAAKKVIRSIMDKAANQLANYPASGKPGRISGTRELVCTDHPFLAVYHVSGGVLEILTIFHTAQNFRLRYHPFE